MQQLCLLQISKVSDTKDTINFKLDSQEITYTVDMFRDTLHFLAETLDKPFIVPINIKVVESFMQTVDYQGTHKNTPRAHRTPTLTFDSPQGKKRKQSAKETSSPIKSLKVTIKHEQVAEGGQDDESYASKFATSMLEDDADDSGNLKRAMADIVIQERDAFQSERCILKSKTSNREKQLRTTVLCMKGQAFSWFRLSEVRSPFRSWEGLKRRLLKRFQPSQEEGLNHAMKLALVIDENKVQSSLQVAVPSGGQTTIKGENF
nr:ankyrin repeat-containing protein [Tanacetum cinerariifolium]